METSRFSLEESGTPKKVRWRPVGPNAWFYRCERGGPEKSNRSPKFTQLVLSKAGCTAPQSDAPCFSPGPKTLLWRALGSVTREQGGQEAFGLCLSQLLLWLRLPLASSPHLCLSSFPAPSQQPCRLLARGPGLGSQGLSSVHCNETEWGPSHTGRGPARVAWRGGGRELGGSHGTGLVLWIQGTGK